MRPTKALALWIMAVSLLGCTHAKPDVPTPPSEVGSVAVLPRDQYRSPDGTVPPALSYVEPDGTLVVLNPWCAPDVLGVGAVASWSAPQWGYDPDYDTEGRAVALHKLVFVTPDSALAQYDARTGQTRELPLDLDGAGHFQASFTPSGEFLVVDLFEEQPPRLVLFRPQSEERLWEVSYATNWVWSPSSDWLAINLSRQSGLTQTTDLAVFNWTDDSTRVIVPGGSGHSWYPIGWASADVLAYADANEPGDSLRWVDVRTGNPPAGNPALGLTWDRDRVARLIPENLWQTWTGQFAVDGMEDFVAVVCQDPGEPPIVYVGSLRDGQWFRLESGDRPAWVQFPRRSWPE